MTQTIRVDDYTHKLVQEVIRKGLASNSADAVDKALASYLGIHYKSREERKMEQDLSRVQELAKKASKEE
ncbi:hypothetical protein ES704_02078 [subsurface metagenome]|jgi:Arc/MetJ family transcription regulator